MSNEVTRPPLKGVWTLVGESWGVYTTKFWSLAAASIIPIAALFLVESAITQALGTSTAAGMVILVARTLGGFVGSFAITSILVEEVGVGEAFRRMPQRIVGYAWVQLLRSFAIVGGALLGLIPGFIFSVELLFAPYVFLGEGKKGVQALMQSKRYTQGYWWATYGRMVGMALIFAIPLLIAYLPVAILLVWDMSSVGEVSLVAETAAAIPMMVLFPVFAAFQYILYRNLREVKPDLVAREAEKPRAWLVLCLVVGGILSVALYMVGGTGYQMGREFSKGSGKDALLSLVKPSAGRSLMNEQRVLDMENIDMVLRYALSQGDLLGNSRGSPCMERDAAFIATSAKGTSAADGTGWIPIDLIIGALPKDPINTAPFVYSFACASPVEYELNAVFELSDGSDDAYREKARNDGGNNPDVYEVGSNLNLIP